MQPDKLAVARYLRSRGKTWSEVSKEVKVPLTTIYKALNKKPKARAKSQAKKEITRRRKLAVKLSEEIEEFQMRPGRTGRAQVRVITRRKNNTARKIALQLEKRHGIKVCSQTVLNDLRECGITSYVCPWGPVRKEADAANRVKLCKLLLSSNHRWDRYCFADEKYANTIEHGRRTELRRKGDAPSHRQRERFTPTIHVFGAIAVGFRKLVILPSGGIDAPTYKRLCLQPIAPTLLQRKITLVHDGAKPHQAEAKQYLINKKIDVCAWTARSPDLSPIERVWAWLQYQVSTRTPPPRNEEELAEAWTAEFYNMPQASLDRLCLEFEMYLRECIRRNGQTIVTSRGMKAKFNSWR